MNDLICDLFVLAPIGAITRVNNRNHLRHHQHLATIDDPDRFKHTCLNKNSIVQLAGYVTSLTSAIRSIGNVFRGSPESARTRVARPSYRLRDIGLLLAVQATIGATLTLTFGWWGWVVLWWLPVYVFAFLADNLRAFIEHSHPESDQAADRHRLITHEPAWLERQLLSPMKMNFHAVHHLWPTIPYYNLPAADARLRAVDHPNLSRRPRLRSRRRAHRSSPRPPSVAATSAARRRPRRSLGASTTS
jgi:fatty acid desaturase